MANTITEVWYKDNLRWSVGEIVRGFTITRINAWQLNGRDIVDIYGVKFGFGEQLVSSFRPGITELLELMYIE